MQDSEQLEQELAQARRIIRVQAEELTQLAAWGQGAWRWLKTYGKGFAAEYLVQNAPASVKES
jgi:hypothetical protein